MAISRRNVLLFLAITGGIMGAALSYGSFLPNAGLRAEAERQNPSLAVDPLAQQRRKVVRIAEDYLGTPYRWGGDNPGGFDCSGFVQYVLRQAGITVPRITFDQFQSGFSVNPDDLQVGDLVFFQTEGRGATHVGIYAGNHLFIQADASRGVKFSSLDHPYWKQSYMGARRVILP